MIYNYLYFLFIYEFVITGYIYIRNFINIFVYIAIWYFIYKKKIKKLYRLFRILAILS